MTPEIQAEQLLGESPCLSSGEAVTRRAWERTLRNLFSFPAVLAMSLLVVVMFTVRLRFSDPDLWWHLKMGEIIWNTHSIPSTDLFSFTANGHPYTPHEWLSQLTIYAAWKLGGNTGLMLWLCLFASLLLVGAYVLCWLYSGNAKIALLGALVTWFFSTIGLAIRPQLLGYLLLLGELLIIHLGRSRDRRWFWALPPLFALWVNCHGSFFLGLIFLASFAFCSFLNVHAGFVVSKRWERGQTVLLCIVFLVCIAALFINPIGLRQILYPLDTMLNQQINLNNVAEWQPLTFGGIRTWGLAILSAFILVAAPLRKTELYLEEVLPVLLAGVFAALHSRMLFVFGIVGAPVICRLLSATWDSYDRRRDRPVANAILIVLSVAIVFLVFPDSRELKRQIEQKNPVKAVEFMRRSKLTARMLNEYVFGGYLVWAAPECPVFIDGRADLYEWAGVLEEYTKWTNLEVPPAALLDKYRINICLLSRDAPIARVLPLLPGWKAIYSDELSILFARTPLR